MSLVVAIAKLSDQPARPGRVPFRDLRHRLGRGLACAAAAAIGGCQPGEFQVGEAGDGGPALVRRPANAQDIVIGITHAGSWVCGAAARGLQRIGIDVEVTKRRNVVGLAAFMGWGDLLSPGQDPAGDDDRFTHLWTLWEAAVKVDGGTLLAPATAAFRSLAPGCQPGGERAWCTDRYAARSLRLDPGHWLTIVAAARQLPALQFRRRDDLVDMAGME